MKSVPPNPSGLCMCGCGQPTPLAVQTNNARGLVKGEPGAVFVRRFGVSPYAISCVRTEKTWPEAERPKETA